MSYSVSRRGNSKAYILVINDPGGKTITRLTGTAIPGTNKVDIDLQGYAPGMYTVTLIDEEHGRRSIQVIKE